MLRSIAGASDGPAGEAPTTEYVFDSLVNIALAPSTTKNSAPIVTPVAVVPHQCHLCRCRCPSLLPMARSHVNTTPPTRGSTLPRL